ncbi:RNA polymerase factor sigma-54 [Lysinibacillus sp. LZ02]|uniref:RNA polymerase factor sigma-54 n=1 Tax=Lysinibacillus sp. LZ02 TaxID=3420668 RepID=UPI003D35D453
MQMMINTSQQVTQVLTAQLMQHLEILQYSSNELEQYIYEKANENPLLMVEDAKVKKNYEEIIKLASITSNPTSRKACTSHDQSFNFVEMQLAQKESYEKYLLEQIPLHKNLSQIDLKILTFLIRSLDERLFLDVDLTIVADQFKTTYAHVEVLLQLLQTFEPIGVGARNFKEYLLIQVDQDLLAPQLAIEFISNDLELVSTQSFKQLSKKYKCTIEEVKNTIYYIKKLKPVLTGDKFEKIPYVFPDVEVKQVEGEWIVLLNDHHLPSVSINESYVLLLKNDSNYKYYYKQSMKDALALIQGIEQRDKTVYELIRMLLETQVGFFSKGMEALKPMRLKDIADQLHVHESTISRAIRGKYIQVPHGIYALQSLFTKGLINASGKMDSVIYVKKRIKQLIENENKQRPLADQHITQILCEEGIQISRRTVAKYREEMNIVSSFNRAHA